MFGYLAPLKSELKMREFEVYNAYYCAICHAVKRRYGELPRLMLSYDAVLIAILAENFFSKGKEPAFNTFRCFNNPLKKRNEVLPSEGIEYAADVMVFLGWLSLRDRKTDGDAENLCKKIATITGEVFIRKAGHKASVRLGEKSHVLSECLEEQQILESAREESLDKAADPTGRMMAELLDFSPAGAHPQSHDLRELGYHLGRYIYIIDAIDDLEKDKGSGAYNPLILRPEPQEALKRAVLLDLSRVCELTDQLNLAHNKGIIDNITYLGLRAKLDEVIAGIGSQDVKTKIKV
jgi:hypothetical protein